MVNHPTDVLTTFKLAYYVSFAKFSNVKMEEQILTMLLNEKAQFN